jgi:hypothetical protein
MSRKSVDIRNFAERVERVCDFFIGKAERDGSADITVLQDLKNDAADVQHQYHETTIVSESITGLSDFMRGVK